VNTPKLSQEERDNLRRVVRGMIKDMLRPERRQELQEQDAVMHGIWAALRDAPTWGIVEAPPPPNGAVIPDELWSVTPVVKKQ
jgi:hypothetical protein